MAKLKVKREKGSNGKGEATGTFTYTKDSKKGTYHTYQVKATIPGVEGEIVGNLYIPHGEAGKVGTITLQKGGGN